MNRQHIVRKLVVVARELSARPVHADEFEEAHDMLMSADAPLRELHRVVDDFEKDFRRAAKEEAGGQRAGIGNTEAPYRLVKLLPKLEKIADVVEKMRRAIEKVRP